MQAAEEYEQKIAQVTESSYTRLKIMNKYINRTHEQRVQPDECDYINRTAKS